MNINIPIKATALSLLLVAATFACAQNKSAIILINSIPYNVVLTPTGEITEIKGEAVGYMRGFVRSADEFSLPPSGIVAFDVRTPGESSVRSERSFVDFERNFATLDENAVIVLDGVVNGFSLSSGENILITGFKENDVDPDKLVKNRLATCRTYLELKGIPSGRILTEIATSAALKDRVTIAYIQ